MMDMGWIVFLSVFGTLVVAAIIVAICWCCASGGGCCWDGKRYGGGWAYGGGNICRTCNQSNCNGRCGGGGGGGGGRSGWSGGVGQDGGWSAGPAVGSRARVRTSAGAVGGGHGTAAICGGCNRFVGNCMCSSR